MTSRALSTTALGFLVACVAVLTAVGPASAAPTPHVPPDVGEAFASTALRQAQAGAFGVEADFSGDIRTDHVHEIFMFTLPFVAGRETTEPVVSTDSWIATVLRGDEVLGVIWVWKPDGGDAQLQGYSGDIELGATLAEVAPTDLLVEDAPTGSWFALRATTVRPLNDWARDLLAAPTDITELQTVVAEQAALRAEQAAESGDQEFWGQTAAIIGPVVIFVVVYGGITVLERRRRGVPAPAA